MNYWSCYFIEKVFDIPLLFMTTSFYKHLEYEIDFKNEEKNQVIDKISYKQKKNFKN